ncbi:MAG: HEAT repeat domain-containing protein [Planctomycetota bacterium]
MTKPPFLTLLLLTSLAAPRLGAQAVDSAPSRVLVGRILGQDTGAPEQLEAVRRLAADPDLPGVPVLVHSLAAGIDENIQRRATLALLALGGIATPALVEALKADDPVQRRNAAGILGLVADPTALPALREAAHGDADEAVRNVAQSSPSIAGASSTMPTDPRLAALRASLAPDPGAAEGEGAATEPASVEASPPAADDPVHLKVARGASILVRLTEEAGRNITQVRVAQGTRTVVSTTVTGQVGPWLVGSRELKLSAAATADLGFYRVEGLERGQVRYVLPISLEVTSGVSSSFASVPTQTDLQRQASARPMQRARLFMAEPMINMAAYRRGLTSFTMDPVLATAATGRSTLEYVRPATVTGSFDFTLTPGEVPPPWIDMVIPEGGTGHVGQTIELRGGDLPCPLHRDAITVFLGNVSLTVVESTPKRVRARLPSTAMTGTLRAIRVSDGMEVIAVANYAVAPFRPFAYFEADPSGYSAMNAYLLAMASQRAYVDTSGASPETPSDYESRVRTEFETLGVEVLDVLHDGSFVSGTAWLPDTQGFILQTDQAMIIALAGTQHFNLSDLNSDLLAVPFWDTGLPGYPPVHKGFWFAGDVVYTRIRNRVRAAGTRRVWLTGHSLGGAMATLIALRLQIDLTLDPTCSVRPRGIMTFGAPRVGCVSVPSFLQAYDAFFNISGAPTRGWRVVRVGDAVPKFPTAFHHAGRLAVLNGGTVEIANPSDSYAVVNPVSGLGTIHFAYFDELEALMRQTPTGMAFSSLWPKAKVF